MQKWILEIHSGTSLHRSKSYCGFHKIDSFTEHLKLSKWF